MLAAADVRQSAVYVFTAARMVAPSGHTVADVSLPTVVAAYGPAHNFKVLCAHSWPAAAGGFQRGLSKALPAPRRATRRSVRGLRQACDISAGLRAPRPSSSHAGTKGRLRMVLRFLRSRRGLRGALHFQVYCRAGMDRPPRAVANGSVASSLFSCLRRCSRHLYSRSPSTPRSLASLSFA